MNGNVSCRGALRGRQSGIALLAFTVLLAIVSVGLLVERLSSRSQGNTARERSSNEVLAIAKKDLIAWSVSHPTEPGRLPWPDRNGDGNYDGASDCVTTGFNNAHLLGRFPHAGDAAPCDSVVLGSFTEDGYGEPLWYAVSRNLLWNRGQGAADPPLNSGLQDPPPSYPSYPWLTVRDENGAILSNRVAAVIIAPGGVVGSQARSGAAPNPNQYLDSVVIGVNTYSNSDSDGCHDDNPACNPTDPTDPDAGEDFIFYPDSRKTTTESDSFNDQLIYITIDEIMRPVEKRVIGEAAVSLRAYRNDPATWSTPPGSFPWLRPFSDPQTATNFDSVVATREGLLPVHQPGGSFSSGFTLNWSSINNAIISTTGTATPAELTDGPVGGLIVAETPDNCTWSDTPGPLDSHSRSVICSGTVTRDTGCVFNILLGLICSREIWSFELYHTGSPASVSISAPSSTDIRRRTVNHTGALPAHPSASPMIDLVKQMELTDLLPGFWIQTGTGTLTTQAGTTGTVDTSGVRYDLDYVDDLELPEWFVTNLWHRYLYAAISADDVPGGAGNCAISSNCLSVNVDTSVISDVPALIISAGGQLGGQDRATSPATESDYFDSENSNGVDTGNPAERGTFTNNFNDQLRIVATGP